MQVKKLTLNVKRDLRGTLIPIEGTDYNFSIKRIFTISECLESRGGHAHRHTNQIAFVPHGNCIITSIDCKGLSRVDYLNLGEGLYLPKMTFVESIELTNSSVLVVLADTKYNYSDSIRTKEEYLNTIK